MAYFMGSFSVSPASPGMIRMMSRMFFDVTSEPRIRGDDPNCRSVSRLTIR